MSKPQRARIARIGRTALAGCLISVLAGCSDHARGLTGDWQLWSVDEGPLAEAIDSTIAMETESGDTALIATRPLGGAIRIYRDGDYEQTGINEERRGMAGPSLRRAGYESPLFDQPKVDTTTTIGRWELSRDSILFFKRFDFASMSEGLIEVFRKRFPTLSDSQMRDALERSLFGEQAIDTTKAVMSGQVVGDKLVVFDRRAGRWFAYRRVENP